SAACLRMTRDTLPQRIARLKPSRYDDRRTQRRAKASVGRQPSAADVQLQPRKRKSAGRGVADVHLTRVKARPERRRRAVELEHRRLAARTAKAGPLDERRLEGSVAPAEE